MASTISAGTTSGTAIAIAGDTSGNLAFQTQNGANTITVPNATGTILTTASTITPSDASVTQAKLATNVVGNGPAFSGYISGYQGGISQSTWTKASLSAEDFDTNSNFNTTNYRFTPTVAGYYQFNCYASMGSAGGTYPNNGQVAIYKNGGAVSASQFSSGTNQIFSIGTSVVVYMNGSTDYAELYVYMTGGTNGALNGGSGGTTLNGCLVRAA